MRLLAAMAAALGLAAASGRATAVDAPPRWTPQASGATARLRGVSAVSATVAWASGADGTVLRTTDGGASWQRAVVADAAALDFRDIDAIDADTAYVLSIGPGDASRIYKTTDGGARWTRQFTNDDAKAFFDAMAFWDAERGLAVSDAVDGRFVIIRTGDGGRTWTRVPAEALPPALPGEGAFAASGTSVAVFGRDLAWLGTGASTSARVLRTTDAGRTWSVATTPLPAGASAGIFSIAFRDARHGVIVGGDYKREPIADRNLAVTRDGGVTWTAVSSTALSGFRSAVAWRPGDRSLTWAAVGPSGGDVSIDDGQSWTPNGTAGFHALAVSRDGVGWAVGERGAIARLDWARGAGDGLVDAGWTCPSRLCEPQAGYDGRARTGAPARPLIGMGRLSAVAHAPISRR